MPAAQPAVLLVAQRRTLETQARSGAQPLRRCSHGIGDEVGAYDLDQLELNGLLARLFPETRVCTSTRAAAPPTMSKVSSPRNPER